MENPHFTSALWAGAKIAALLSIPAMGFIVTILAVGKRRCRRVYLFLLFFTLFLMIFGATGYLANTLLRWEAFRNVGSPGRAAYFEIPTDTKSIFGYWLGASNSHADFVMEHNSPTGPNQVPWPVTLFTTADWGGKITYKDKLTEEAIILKGKISIPQDPKLTGKTIEGVIRANIRFPYIAGKTSFSNTTENVCVPCRLKITEESYICQFAATVGGGAGSGITALWFFFMLVGVISFFNTLERVRTKPIEKSEPKPKR